MAKKKSSAPVVCIATTSAQTSALVIIALATTVISRARAVGTTTDCYVPTPTRVTVAASVPSSANGAGPRSVCGVAEIFALKKARRTTSVCATTSAGADTATLDQIFARWTARIKVTRAASPRAARNTLTSPQAWSRRPVPPATSTTPASATSLAKRDSSARRSSAGATLLQ